MNLLDPQLIAPQINEIIPSVMTTPLMLNVLIFAVLAAIPVTLSFDLQGWEREDSVIRIRKRVVKLLLYQSIACAVAFVIFIFQLFPANQMIFAVALTLLAMKIALNNILPFTQHIGLVWFLWGLMLNLWVYHVMHCFGHSVLLVYGTFFNLFLLMLVSAILIFFVMLFHRLNQYRFFVNYGIQILSAVVFYVLIYWFSGLL
ncbi:hypothetical protein [Aliiglaciecola sp. M165]|uniref:hypothetical protein n=1 Tax=Aliiglaciecola sp. M165 TaxID=2593649 RepID=UPI00117D7AED|nr:hypothetical protein [Aliiglaciecola sp. M165]TRY31466.1 hypothetical protein FM019_11380 [Aliiglaciecola sp. M165]